MKTQAISYKLVGVQVSTTRHGSHLSISSNVANLCALGGQEEVDGSLGTGVWRRRVGHAQGLGASVTGA